MRRGNSRLWTHLEWEMLLERRTFLLSTIVSSSAAPQAAPIDPNQTFVLQRDDVRFEPWNGLPPGSGEMAKLYGDFDQPGPYLVLMRWNAGWFSAPHSYGTDRIQMVLSGTWWVNGGRTFLRPTRCVSRRAASSSGQRARSTTTAFQGLKKSRSVEHLEHTLRGPDARAELEIIRGLIDSV